jgi:uncharacterized membrane protein
VINPFFDMFNLAPQWYLIPLVLHCGVGVVAALTAQKKGFNLKRWLVFGVIVGTPALIVALLAKPRATPAP